jgi:site-specific DNA-cytosine methylase
MAKKLLIGGSPCTYWSIAQKNNRETEASGMGWELFKNYLIAKEKFKPDFFLYENNKSAAQAIKDQIAEELGVGVDPDVRFTYINSALVSAQNRQRFYVTNFGDIEQPEDRGILLKDILETGVIDKDKAYCLKHQAGNTRDYFKKHHTQVAAEPVYIGEVPEHKGTYRNGKQASQQYRVYDTNAKGVAVTTAAITNVAEPVCHVIPQEVRVRKYTCDINKFQDCLRDHKTLTSREIADILCKPITEVEHWFRKDKCFSIPDPDIWFALKKLLGIETDEYDDFVTVFETREGVFEKSHRCYDVNGKMSTLLTSSNDNIIEPVRVGCMPSPDGTIKGSQAKRIYDIDGKSVNLTANGGGEGAKTGLYAIPVNTTDDGDKARTLMAGYYKYGTATLLTNEGFKGGTTAVAETVGYATPCEWDENGIPIKAVSCADGKTYTVYEVKDGQITIKGKQYAIKLADEYYIIRKLTVRECARLQTMPDDYCKALSDSQAYKALGNGWTAEVIIHLLNHALKDVPRDEEIIVLSLYDGIATGRYCLDKMGFTNVKYHAYEIDKYPITAAMDNYPDIIQHGDAFAVREDDWKAPQTRSEWLDDLLGV